jgi:hypothetical protein
MALALTNWCVDGLYLPDEVIDRITRAILDKSIIFAVTPSLGMWTLVDYWVDDGYQPVSYRHPYHADLHPAVAADTHAFRNDRIFAKGLERLRGNAHRHSCLHVKIPIATLGHPLRCYGEGDRRTDTSEYRSAHADHLMLYPQLLTAYQLKDYLAMNEIHFRKSWTKKKLIKACMSF